MQGDLYAAAYTAAEQGNRTTAHALIAQATATADRLGRDATLHGAVFGSSQVLLHQISVCHLLGDAGRAIGHAAASTSPACPPPNARPAAGPTSPRAFEQARLYHIDPALAEGIKRAFTIADGPPRPAAR